MKKTLTIIFLFQIYVTALAQDLKQLNGSWQSFGNVILKDENDSVSYKDIKFPSYILTINNATTHLSNYPVSHKSDSAVYMECSLKLKEKKQILRLKNIRRVDSTALLNDDDSYCYYGERQQMIFEYQILSDSELVLTEVNLNVNGEWPYEGVCTATYRLKKIPTIRYALISELKNRHENEKNRMLGNKLYLTKYDSLNKLVKLKVGGEFEIHTEKKSQVSCYVDEAIYYVDAVDSLVNDSAIMVHTTQQIITTHDNDGDRLKKTKYNRSYFYKAPLTEIKLSEISYISYNGPKSSKAHNISKNIGWASLFSALVVSPLVSINYRRADFNKQRYFTVAGISLSAMTISFTIAGITNYTQYLIGKNYRKHGWRIINKPSR